VRNRLTTLRATRAAAKRAAHCHAGTTISCGGPMTIRVTESNWLNCIVKLRELFGAVGLLGP
jgi:hypothetical protein